MTHAINVTADMPCALTDGFAKLGMRFILEHVTHLIRKHYRCTLASTSKTYHSGCETARAKSDTNYRLWASAWERDANTAYDELAAICFKLGWSIVNAGPKLEVLDSTGTLIRIDIDL